MVAYENTHYINHLYINMYAADAKNAALRAEAMSCAHLASLGHDMEETGVWVMLVFPGRQTPEFDANFQEEENAESEEKGVDGSAEA